MTGLTAPFPYFGGKRRWAARINARIGQVDRYVEPFAGSLAVLLQAPARPFEIVCDRNGFVANFWRAIRDDPEAVARAADWPTNHTDLIARHRWLIRWGAEHAEHLIGDPDWYEAKAAGWWAWGASNWIGGDWCAPTSANYTQRPYVQLSGSGVGVNQDTRPRACQRQRGNGCSTNRQSVRGDESPDMTPGLRLLDWFHALARRLERVIVINRSWESLVTDTMLAQVPSSPDIDVGVFLDPPYLLGARSANVLYQSDVEGSTDDVARASYEWAVAAGRNPRLRIVYCCHDGDFPVPHGWTAETDTFGGVRDPERRRKSRDLVMFSPACSQQRQASLFDAGEPESP